MRNLLLWLMMGFGLLSLVRGAEVFDYGTRPESGVYDPERALSDEVTSRLEKELMVLRKRDLVDVLVVVVPRTGELEPEHLAQRFSENWGRGVLHAVVLDSLNRKDGPWIYFGGGLTQFDGHGLLSQLNKEILRRSRQEPDRESALKAAAFECGDMMRFLLGKTKWDMEVMRSERLRMQLMAEESIRQRKMLLYGGIAALVPLLALVILALLAFIRSRPRRFPAIAWNRRFGAPYAGGNSATLELKRRKKRS